MGKWSNLPADLLYAIEEHLVLYIEKVRIRTVSLEWNSYLPKLADHRAMQTPLLLHQIDDDEEATHGLFNPVDSTIYKIYLPEALVKIFKGSSFGWIITVEDFYSTSPNDIRLINPVTRAQIKLPPRTEFPDIVRYSPDKPMEEFTIRVFLDVRGNDSDEDFVDERSMAQCNMTYYMMLKIVLSHAPNHNECVVIAIYGQKAQLAWCKINNKDKRWTHIYTDGLCNFIDILYSKNCLYALCEGYEGQVFMFENIGTDLDITFKEIAMDRIPVPVPSCAYLAECSDGSLMAVVRHFFEERNQEGHLFTRTKEFKVYKLTYEPDREKRRKADKMSIDLLGECPSDSNLSWVEVKSIGDDVLFVGFGSVRSISSLNFVGCNRNHIYFSDSDNVQDTFEKNKKDKSDVGVFNLEDGTVELLQGLSEFIWPRPIWTNIC